MVMFETAFEDPELDEGSEPSDDSDWEADGFQQYIPPSDDEDHDEDDSNSGSDYRSESEWETDEDDDDEEDEE
ncbi:hypothetical protein SISNIDRAFT_459068 [Sistotremastrum niveocremeum HHB9708]|uniref:Uncharacterized protein n=2 Tax=Sistotremastraceae TaxID=3402574 RepID=A0A164PWD9_9AGAM|nr:hypothetical protein SISNIDRAFT_459068 [Sistotremastrum niveocremeum HHB9708]KZT34911.1 hypothetical protein SISSUDRAFT_1052159 [Sistotremastrum suecicum HHB10207 ss-3]